MNRSLPPALSRLLALTLLLAVLAAAWALFVEPLRTAFATENARIERAHDLLQRYDRALAGEAELRAEIERLRQSDSGPDPFLKGESSQIIAANLQNQIQTMVSGDSSEFRSTQVLPEAQEEGFEKIGLRVTLTASVPAMQKLLYDIEAAVPALFIDNLDIRTNVRRRRNVEVTDRLQIRFDVFGYRKLGARGVR